MSLKDEVDDILIKKVRCILGNKRICNRDEIDDANEIINAVLNEVKEACKVKEFQDRSFYLLCKAIEKLKDKDDE